MPVPDAALVFEQLAAFGIGCDIAGGYLLAVGLLRTPAAIRRRSTWAGLYPGGVVDDAEDRAVAAWGLEALMTGFVCQLAAVILVLSFGASSGGELTRGVVASLVALAPVAVVLRTEHATRRARVDRLLIRVACEDATSNSARSRRG